MKLPIFIMLSLGISSLRTLVGKPALDFLFLFLKEQLKQHRNHRPAGLLNQFFKTSRDGSSSAAPEQFVASYLKQNLFFFEVTNSHTIVLHSQVNVTLQYL